MATLIPGEGTPVPYRPAVAVGWMVGRAQPSRIPTSWIEFTRIRIRPALSTEPARAVLMSECLERQDGVEPAGVECARCGFMLAVLSRYKCAYQPVDSTQASLYTYIEWAPLKAPSRRPGAAS
jgi:hypothetical protein